MMDFQKTEKLLQASAIRSPAHQLTSLTFLNFLNFKLNIWTCVGHTAPYGFGI